MEEQNYTFLLCCCSLFFFESIATTPPVNRNTPKTVRNSDAYSNEYTDIPRICVLGYPLGVKLLLTVSCITIDPVVIIPIKPIAKIAPPIIITFFLFLP